MYIHFSALLPVAALAAVAAAAPSAPVARDGTECGTGTLQCCNETYSAKESGIMSLYGLDCTPITGNAASCTQQTVCCTGVIQNGVVNTGCTIVNQPPTG